MDFPFCWTTKRPQPWRGVQWYGNGLSRPKDLNAGCLALGGSSSSWTLFYSPTETRAHTVSHTRTHARSHTHSFVFILFQPGDVLDPEVAGVSVVLEHSFEFGKFIEEMRMMIIESRSSVVFTWTPLSQWKCLHQTSPVIKGTLSREHRIKLWVKEPTWGKKYINSWLGLDRTSDRIPIVMWFTNYHEEN